LKACARFGEKIAIIDGETRLSYARYGQIVEDLARGFIGAGITPGDRIAIFLPNSWEFAAAYHAATLADAIPTPVNTSYKEREVRYQLENSGARLLITDGALIATMNLSGLPALQRVYSTRTAAPGTHLFADLLRGSSSPLPQPAQPSEVTLAALPFSSGTTGLPKGVRLSHYNLVANVYQLAGPNTAPFSENLTALLFLPLYHIYGLNVVLNPFLMLGGTLVLMARFDPQRAAQLIGSGEINFIPAVPPVINVFSQMAEAGAFPKNHHVRWVKSGAAPLAPEVASRFTGLTGIKVVQGYGMTEASPVTHVGFEEGVLYRPASIGGPVAKTDCRILNEQGEESAPGEIGELVMRGPQFMRGYWQSPESTADVLRDGWYYSGDVARIDELGLYYIVDRRKEMIKYKGLPIAPAEVESVLLDCPLVRDAGVVAKPDADAGEVPCAFVVLREGVPETEKTQREICGFAAERLAGYKQPREIRFVSQIPRNPSGKVLRRELRNQV
ncbi:MAG: class I adenylate-forming enzyme family protein, partial [Terriglobales bacterium]